MTVVGLLELGRGDQSDLAVQASVVEPVDVFGDGDLQVVDVLPRSLVADQLGLEQRAKRLGQGVIAAVAGTADGGDGAGLGQALGLAHGEVLDSLVAVVRHPGDVGAVTLRAPDAHLQGVQRKDRSAARWTTASRPPAGSTRR